MEEKKKVLLFTWVSPFLRGLILPKFAEIGCEVKTLFTYKEVVAVVKKEKPDIILGTISMDMGTDGFEALKELQDNPFTRDIPFLVLSDSDKEAEKKKALHLGAKDYLVLVEWTANEVMGKIKSYL